MNAAAANSVFHALQSIAKTVARPVSRIDIGRTARDFADQDANKLDAIGRVAAKVTAACYGGTSYANIVMSDDFAVFKEFMQHAEADFALSDFTVPDTKVDQPHSPDESHYLDQEKR
jgi:hypothetical protein